MNVVHLFWFGIQQLGVDLELKPLVSPLLFNLRARTPVILPIKVFIYIC